LQRSLADRGQLLGRVPVADFDQPIQGVKIEKAHIAERRLDEDVGNFPGFAIAVEAPDHDRAHDHLVDAGHLQEFEERIDPVPQDPPTRRDQIVVAFRHAVFARQRYIDGNDPSHVELCRNVRRDVAHHRAVDEDSPLVEQRRADPWQ
jgi:hypothetical protein